MRLVILILILLGLRPMGGQAQQQQVDSLTALLTIVCPVHFTKESKSKLVYGNFAGQTR